MMYPFMTLNDETEIVHSDMKENGTVKVYIERPYEQYGLMRISLLNQFTYISRKENLLKMRQRYGLPAQEIRYGDPYHSHMTVQYGRKKL